MNYKTIIMKKIFLLVVFSLIICCIHAQVMSAKAVWVTYKSANLRCWECKQRLEKYLDEENKASFESGIIQWKINLLQGEIKLQYYPDRVSADEIKTAINNAGFDTDTDKAEPDAYKKLPPQCKRPEDGGGPKKNMPCHLPPNG
jgi:copper chaperone CopZ